MSLRKISDEGLLAIIVRLTEQNGVTTVREVAEAAGLTSTSTAWSRVQRLRERGLVEPGRRLRASSVGALMAQASPEVLLYQLEVRIDPSAPIPVRVSLSEQ